MGFGKADGIGCPVALRVGKCTAFLFAAVIWEVVGPGSAYALTFQQTLEQISDGHPRVSAADEAARAGRYNIDAAKAARLPQISLIGDAGYRHAEIGAVSSTAFSPGVQATQLLYDGGRTNAEVRRRSARADELDVNRDATFESLSSQLAEAWGEWARQRALLAIASQQVEALETLHGTVRSIASYDRGRASDVSLVATRLSQAINTRDARAVAVEDALGTIRRIAVAQIQPEGDLPLPDPLLPISLDAAKARSDDGPSVRAAAFKRDQARAQADAARAYWKPSISLNAGGYSQDDAAGKSKMFSVVEVKLRSSLPAYDGGAGRSGKNAAISQLSAAEQELRFTREEAEAEVGRLWSLIAERRKRIATLAGLIADTDASRDIVFEQFKIGRRSVLDLLSFEIDRFGARTSLESEKRDLIQTEYRLLAVMGSTGKTIVPSWKTQSERAANGRNGG